MKKLIFLTFLVMTLLVFGVVGQSTDTTIVINPDITIDITPLPLDFGPVDPGTTNNPSDQPLGFDPAGSNVDVTVTVTDVTGNSLFDNIEVDTGDGSGFNTIIGATETFICDSSGGTCVYTPGSWNAILDVPEGFPAGSPTGTIMYSVTGPPP